MLIASLLLLAVSITTVSVMLAARFFQARYDNVAMCALAVVLGAAISYAFHWFLGGGFLAWILTAIFVTLSFAAVLKVGVGPAAGITVVAIVLQLSFVGALTSFAPEKAKEIGRIVQKNVN